MSEKAMAPHSSTLAWKIPWTEEPGSVQSMGSLRVGHDWVTSLSLFTFMHWRRKWQPTPVFSPGESQGQGSLVGCRLWGRTVGHDWSDLAAVAAMDLRKSKSSRKNIYFCFIDYAKAFDCVDHHKLWKILEEMEYQTTWPASWEICMQVRKQQLEHGTTDWFQIGKGVCQGYILSPCLFNLYAEYIMRNAGLDEAQNQDCQEKHQLPQIWRSHHPYGRKWRRTKEPLDESESGEWKSCLKAQNSGN